MRRRFGDELARIEFQPEITLYRDFTNYTLGPHTDHASRAVVFLLYLPANADRPELGTSLYVPKDRKFSCRGGPVYEHDEFEKAFTADYVPNAGIAFVKTSNSFHGVEPVTEPGHERNILQNAVRFSPESGHFKGSR